MKEKILKAIIATLAIITLTISDFLLLGVNISYGVDAITEQTATNHNNVDFEVFFKNDKGEKVYNNKAQINIQDVKLYACIEVKQEGYFNGMISLGNSNFDINSNFSNTYINKIENNVITLNKINAGDKVELEISIKPIQSDSFNISFLNIQSEINLNGTYINSTQKDINIEATRKIELSLFADQDDKLIELCTEILTNQVLNVSGENKRVVQVLVNSGIKNNVAPIKNTKIEMQTPITDTSKIEKVEAYALNVDATNSSLAGDLTEKLDIDEENSKVSLYIENNANSNNEVEWKKSGKDRIIFTFICEEDAEVITDKLRIESAISLYSSNEFSVTAWNEIEKIIEANGITTTEFKSAENSIYKGKLYAGIDREYVTKTNVDVNMENVAESISIKENAGEYYADDNKLNSSNIYYSKTTLNKNNIKDILGDEGSVTILDQNGNKISDINVNTETDENGNIIIAYNDSEVKSIEIITTVPVRKGKITILNTKVLKNTNENTIKLANKIVTNIDNNYTEKTPEVTETIELKESSIEASMEINKGGLYTLTENKDIEIRAILKTNNESYDLYKNPTITFTLPEEVENVELKGEVQLLYDDELKIEKTYVNEREITIELSGEQTKYMTSKDIEGATIVLTADIRLNKTSASNTRSVTMKYTNNQQGNYKIESRDLNIISQQGIIAVNNIEELGVETIGEEEQKEINIKVGQEEKRAVVKDEVINNVGVDISNVKVIGDFPTNSEKENMGIKTTSPIALNGVNAKVYYSDNENATDELTENTTDWYENINENSKKYLVVIDEMKKSDRLNIEYEIEIPANLEYNQKAKQGYTINYINANTNSKETKASTYVNLTTGQGPVVETSLSAKVGNDDIKNNGTVKVGEIIKYNIQVKNTGSEVANNIEAKADIPNGTIYVEKRVIKEKEPISEEIPGNVDKNNNDTNDDIEGDYEEDEGSQQEDFNIYNEQEEENKEFTIESLNPGETKNLEFEVRVIEKDDIKNKVTIKYQDVIKTSNELTTKVENANLRISIESWRTTDAPLFKNTDSSYYAVIENIGRTDLNNVKVEWNIPEELSIISQDINGVRQEQTSNISTINNIKSGEKISIILGVKVVKANEIKIIKVSAKATQGSDVYRSNVDEHILQGETSVNEIVISSDNENAYLKTGDIVNYNIIISNRSNLNRTVILPIRDEIPSELTPIKIIIDEEEQELNSDSSDEEENNNNEEQEEQGNSIFTVVKLNPNEEKIITIQAIVDYDESREQDIRIFNKALLFDEDGTEKESNSISHIIEAEEKVKESEEVPIEVEEDPVENDEEANLEDMMPDIEDESLMNGGDEGDTENNGQGNIGDNEGQIEENNGRYKINGIAWIDENSDGQMQNDEKLFEGIKAKLLDINTNKIVTDSEGKEITATTDKTGFYTLSGIKQGRYIVVFEYDSSKYTLTQYNKDGVQDSRKSKVIDKDLNFEGREKKYAITDTILIENDNISNINIGLIEAKMFDLKLDKYINKVIVQNGKGTSVHNYNNEALAKVEIDAKNLNNSMVILEYTIAITNVGELEGYVTNIADYVPNGLKFSSELNKDWYQSGANLYNVSLANEKIKAGETKYVTLVLTKTMTENNTGRVSNTAEIQSAYNEADVLDTNSTPGNNTKGENDQGQADVIISIKTGAVAMYTILIVSVLVIIGTTVYIINKKSLTKEI